jgi:hypothetical protein
LVWLNFTTVQFNIFQYFKCAKANPTNTHACGGFLKWGYPQIIHLNGTFQYKPSS